MDNLFILANYYYNFGFNITHISVDRDRFHKNLRASYYHLDRILKAPTHHWESLQDERQTLKYLRSHDWKNAVGLGLVLGFKKVRALDIDGCSSQSLITEMLEVLGLPKNYEWVVRSGSNNGFHIIFYCEEHDFPIEEGKVKAFLPNDAYFEEFQHIELRWNGHLVLPPSMHPTYNNYKFINGTYPLKRPKTIELSNLYSLVSKFCGIVSFEAWSQFYTNYELTTIDPFNENTKVPITQSKHIDVSGKYLDFDLQDTNGTKTNAEGNKIEFLQKENYYRQLDNGEYSNGHNIYIQKETRPYFLFFDTETTGIPLNRTADITDLNNWPRLVQLAYILCHSSETGYDDFKDRNIIAKGSFIIKPSGFTIPTDASKVHGITNEFATKNGKSLQNVLNHFQAIIKQADYVVAHNMGFDEKVIGAEFLRSKMTNPLTTAKKICTMQSTIDICAIPGNNGLKWPTLSELHQKLFGKTFQESHNASVDIDATAKCFWELKRTKQISI